MGRLMDDVMREMKHTILIMICMALFVRVMDTAAEEIVPSSRLTWELSDG